MKQIVIIGNSAAGVAAVEAIRSKDKESKIIVLSNEDYPSYCRCVISDYLAGKVNQDKLIYRPNEFFKDYNVELILNKNILQVNPKKNQISAEDKTKFDYDYLVLANGASPKFPEIKGKQKQGVFGFRTVKDAKDILDLAQLADTACVIGGGLIGLKAAYGLKKRGLDVKIIIKSKQVLSQVIDTQAAGMFQKLLQDNGIEIITGADAQEIVGNGDVKAVKLDSGKVIGCQVVVIAKGVSPNIDIVKESNIKTNEGVVVNEFLKTSVDNIFAAGDVAQTLDIVTGESTVNALWPNAVEQGKLAGLNIAGEKIAYEGSIGINSVEFFGLPMVSMGIFRQQESHETAMKTRPQENIYKKLVFAGNRLVGAVFVGDIAHAGVYLQLIREKTDISQIKNIMLNDNFGYPNVKDLMNAEDRIYV